MKKYVLFFTILFTQFSLNAQTEYIDISKIGMLKTSTMAIYNDDVNYNDLEVFRLNIFSNPKHYHWVKYTNIGKNKIILTLSDDEGDVREICTKKMIKKLNVKYWIHFQRHMNIHLMLKSFRYGFLDQTQILIIIN